MKPDSRFRLGTASRRMRDALDAALAFDGGFIQVLMAQNPFGAPKPAAEPQVVRHRRLALVPNNSEPFYREISSPSALRSPRVALTLLVISFRYGSSRAGPGHGKR